MASYYNEFDPFAAAWLRELIKAKLIPQGDVDDRPIQDVQPNDLRDYIQCHFFAGIGGWSEALRLAGWDSSRPVWPGSCPCQPFSSAGKQKGKADERHLWPVWLDLIRECRPPVIFGEQVASAIAHGWLDDVYEGLEAEGYAVGAAVLPAYSVGAPHKRDRLWFVGHAQYDGSSRGSVARGDGQAVFNHPQGQDSTIEFERAGQSGNVANPIDQGSQRHGRSFNQPVQEGRKGTERHPRQAGVWINCPDGKQRLIEPGIRLLAHGVQNRVGKLRGYGNAIVPQVAAEFIKSYRGACDDL